MFVPVRRLHLTLMTVWLSSCAPGSSPSDSSSTHPTHPQRDSSTSSGIHDSGAPDPSDDGPDPTQAPRVLSGDIWCYEHNTGEVRYYWTLAARATDPQGDPTLQSLHEGLSAWSGDTLLVTYTVVCTENGICTSSFEEVEDNIQCANATSYQFLLEVTDEDGNRSAPYALTGRIGTDASGR